MKTILIVGGGHAGVAAAKGIEGALKPGEATIILISSASSFFYNIAAPRAMFQKDFAPKAFISYDKLFVRSENTVRVGIVKSVLEGKVILQDNQEIAYDFLVIATGTSVGAPFKPVFTSKEDGLAQLGKTADIIVAAKRIIVAGGGASGIETACEIKNTFPDKELTLVHNGPRLLSTSGVTDAFKDKVKAKVESFGIKVILGDRVKRIGTDHVTAGTKTYSTEKGVSIEADAIIYALGIGKFNSDLVKTLNPDLINALGEIKVTPTLQLDNPKYTNIFSFGDVATTHAPKMVAVIPDQTPVLVANVVMMLRRGHVAKLFKPSSTKLMFLDLGPKDALGEVGGMPWFLTNYLAKSLKCAHMFVDKATKELNQPWP